MSDEVEHYLAAYNQADDIAIQVKAMADSIARMAHALRASPKIACTEALANYPTGSQTQMCTLVDRLEQAKDQLRQLWDCGPGRDAASAAAT
jgi:hypothetical protein